MMQPLIARRQLIKVLAVDAVAFPMIALVFLTQPKPVGFSTALAIFFASTSLQALLLVQGARDSRALR
jgi:uncharacterized membrane protein